MADCSDHRSETRTYHNNAVTAGVVQQGTGNAARDINHAGRDISTSLHIESHFHASAGKYPPPLRPTLG